MGASIRQLPAVPAAPIVLSSLGVCLLPPHTCRKALELIDPAGEHAHVYVYVQGNLGALLLSADRPAEAIAELQDALQLGQQLQKQLKQQIKRLRKKSRADKKQQKQQGEDDQQQAVLKLQEALQEVQKQLGGLLFNLGKALTSVGRY